MGGAPSGAPPFYTYFFGQNRICVKAPKVGDEKPLVYKVFRKIIK